MNIIYVSGSPRKNSNTDYLLNRIMEQAGGDLLKLCDYAIAPCRSCWACVKKGSCVIDDDMNEIIIPRILDADAIIIGTPVYFNNVSAQLKSFIDRTWSIRGKLNNKIGAAVVVGRRYGAEGAVAAINSFFLKHDMIIANRGITGVAYQAGDIKDDRESMEAVATLASRILELDTALVFPEKDDS